MRSMRWLVGIPLVLVFSAPVRGEEISLKTFLDAVAASKDIKDFNESANEQLRAASSALKQRIGGFTLESRFNKSDADSSKGEWEAEFGTSINLGLDSSALNAIEQARTKSITLEVGALVQERKANAAHLFLEATASAKRSQLLAAQMAQLVSLEEQIKRSVTAGGADALDASTFAVVMVKIRRDQELEASRFKSIVKTINESYGTNFGADEKAFGQVSMDVPVPTNQAPSPEAEALRAAAESTASDGILESKRYELEALIGFGQDLDEDRKTYSAGVAFPIGTYLVNRSRFAEKQLEAKGMRQRADITEAKYATELRIIASQIALEKERLAAQSEVVKQFRSLLQRAIDAKAEGFASTIVAAELAESAIEAEIEKITLEEAIAHLVVEYAAKKGVL